MSSKTWVMDEAIALVRLLEPKLARAGFNLALAGSVLTKGASDHDLDLVVFPHDASSVHIEVAKIELTMAGLIPMASRAKVAGIWERKGSTDTKHVERWNYKGKLIDLFFLR